MIDFSCFSVIKLCKIDDYCSPRAFGDVPNAF